jgi:hypothetical protein
MKPAGYCVRSRHGVLGATSLGESSVCVRAPVLVRQDA